MLNKKFKRAMIAPLMAIFTLSGVLVGCSGGSDQTAQSSGQEWQGEDLNIREVRNDKTGKWRIATVTSSTPQDEYAYEYYLRYMKDNSEGFNSLFIVNRTLNTTTQILDLGTIYVSVHEYVEGEERDADLLNTGLELDEYSIDPETGEVL